MVAKEGINAQRAATIFTLLREAGVTQCVECGGELSNPMEGDGGIIEGDSIASTSKRGRKGKGSTSRASTRQNSPSVPVPHPILTRCQHLFCVECFRMAVTPGWPNISPEIQTYCSVCQTALTPYDVVEVHTECLPPELTPKRKTRKREKRQTNYSITRGIQNSNNIKYIDDILMLRII